MHKKKGIIFKMERKTSGKKKGGDTAKHHDISMSSPVSLPFRLSIPYGCLVWS